MNMFKPVKAHSIEEYMKMLTPERLEIIKKLSNLIQETAPTLKPHFAYNMLGFGSFKYIDYKKVLIAWPIVSLASQKNYISLYICALDNGEYLAEKYADKLGKVNVGRSCIRFKKIEDLNLEEIKRIIKLAAKNPGLK